MLTGIDSLPNDNARDICYVAGLQCGAFQMLSLQIEDRSSFMIMWIEMCQLMGIARSAPTICHSQHNGKIETMHRCFKTLAACRTSWKTKLVGRVTVGNDVVTRNCQPGDRIVSITAGHR